MIRRAISTGLNWRFRAVVERLNSLHGRVEDLDRSLQAVEKRSAELCAALAEVRQLTVKLLERSAELPAVSATLEQRLLPMLRVLVDEESQNRRRLFALRDSSDYERAYGKADALVSIVVATIGGTRPLVERALPSLLAQTHANLEVIVVGDATAPELNEAVAALGDPRVRFTHLSHRLVSHPELRRHRLVGSTMARNEAARHARGTWLMHFDDDDCLRPHAIATLLDVAREHRAEVAYGGFEQHRPSAPASEHLRFPPEWGHFAWPAALIHGGLRFFERELIASELELPGDMYMLLRMLRAGVSFAMHDGVLLDYFPSTFWAEAEPSHSSSVLASLTHHGPLAHEPDAGELPDSTEPCAPASSAARDDPAPAPAIRPPRPPAAAR